MSCAPTLTTPAPRETAAAVSGKSGKALALKVDVTKRGEAEGMVRNAIEAFGNVQFLFNSAGAAIRRAKFLEIDDELMDKTFALNVNGTYAMQAVLPHMLANKHRRHCRHGEHGASARRPRLVDPLRRGQGRGGEHDHGCGARVRDQGIRALSISPGPIKTPFQDAAQSSPELIRRFLDDIPMGRFGEPEEIGELVLFLCSDACPFMTADTVYVNGGGGWR